MSGPSSQAARQTQYTGDPSLSAGTGLQNIQYYFEPEKRQEAQASTTASNLGTRTNPAPTSGQARISAFDAPKFLTDAILGKRYLLLENDHTLTKRTANSDVLLKNVNPSLLDEQAEDLDLALIIMLSDNGYVAAVTCRAKLAIQGPSGANIVQALELLLQDTARVLSECNNGAWDNVTYHRAPGGSLIRYEPAQQPGGNGVVEGEGSDDGARGSIGGLGLPGGGEMTHEV